MKTLKREEIHANEYRDLDDLRTNIRAFIEQYYNRLRLHSALGYRPPEEFEQAASSATASQGATMSFFRHPEIFRSDVHFLINGGPKPVPRTIVSMSLRLVIPRRVGLSPPPLHQPGAILKEKSPFE